MPSTGAVTDWLLFLFIIIIVIFILNYLAAVALSRLSVPLPLSSNKQEEGFEDAGTGASQGESAISRYDWLRGEDIYDDFYVRVYPKITQFHKVLQSEAALIMTEWKKTESEQSVDPKNMKILDIGCGTGIAAAAFAKFGAGRVIGLDRSAAMIRAARDKTLPATTLTETEKDAIEFRHQNAYSPSALNGGEITHTYLVYFTIYYFHDMTTLFRNIAFWTRPGGKLAIEVVDKYRFEAIPDSSNPWIGVNPQRYKKDRITKGTVEFDRFTYETEFNLYDPRAEFNETFRFKDGTIRRHKHELYMYDINKIVEMAAESGWKFDKSAELMPFGFPHAFILFFTRTSGQLPALETATAQITAI